MSDWGISCAKCGHPASYHGMTFCQVQAGAAHKRPCDCDGYAISTETPAADADVDHAVALEREAICKWLSSLPKVDGEPIEDVYTLEGIATLIRSGAHNQGGEREGNDA